LPILSNAMDIEIRPITYEERPDWIRAGDTAFSHLSKDDEIEASLPVIEPDRSFAALDDGRIVGTSGAITFRMMVPGGARVPTAGVTMVGVHPTHRRRGINTGMMRAVLHQAVERGEPLAALFASEGAIYGRFGYGLAGMFGEFQAESARMAYVKGYESTGRVELLSKD
jgi:predicted N-acetyltransferase YhbS